jgi:hypothetical protein
MPRQTSSFVELLWRGFFIGKQIYYTDQETEIETLETIEDLFFTPKLRTFTIKFQSGLTCQALKDDEFDFELTELKIIPPITKGRIRGKKRR